MIPVEDGNTSLGLILRNCARPLQTFLQARIPAAPVAQLALPELTITARTWPWLLASELRPTSTGAAVTRFLVKSAAALVGRSARMSARSEERRVGKECRCRGSPRT